MAIKPYSYHAQLLLLTQALDFMKKVSGFLDQALEAENAQLGIDEAAMGDYWALAQAAENLTSSLTGVTNAVTAMATMCPPDLVEPHDPTDYSADKRFQQMINNTFDVALGHGVEPDEVIRALYAAVDEGDQR